MVCMFSFARCINIIFNSLLSQLIKVKVKVNVDLYSASSWTHL